MAALAAIPESGCKNKRAPAPAAHTGAMSRIFSARSGSDHAERL
jgi:hypothetical protein